MANSPKKVKPGFSGRHVHRDAGHKLGVKHHCDPLVHLMRCEDKLTGSAGASLDKLGKKTPPSLVVRLRLKLNRDRFVTVCERDDGAVDVVFHGGDPVGNGVPEKALGVSLG